MLKPIDRNERIGNGRIEMKESKWDVPDKLLLVPEKVKKGSEPVLPAEVYAIVCRPGLH